MKINSRAQSYRIKRIVDLIRKGTLSGVLPNCSLFSKEFGVTTRTIMNDLDYLRDEKYAPIEYVPSKNGYRLTDQTWVLPVVTVSNSEVFAFSIARKLMNSFRGTPLEADMESVLNKIGETIEGNVSLSLKIMTEHFTVIGDDYVVQDPLIWKAVCNALDSRAQVRIVYEKFNSDIGEYVLDPYHLFAYHGNWYVAASNTLKNTIATFALSRIRSIEETSESFTVPDSFDSVEYARTSFGIVRGAKVFRVRLLVSRNIAGYIKERVWHPTQKIVQKRNGDIELVLKTAGWKELVRWILSWQPDVKVITPKILRDRVHEKLQQSLRSDHGF